MSEKTIFSKIIANELPSYKLWENEHLILILDIKPVSLGHCLLIPKVQVDYIFDLDTILYSMLWEECRWISKILKQVTGKRIGIAVEGLSVPHVHIHLVPIENIGDLDPYKAKEVTSDELLEIQELILEQMP